MSVRSSVRSSILPPIRPSLLKQESPPPSLPPWFNMMVSAGKGRREQGRAVKGKQGQEKARKGREREKGCKWLEDRVKGKLGGGLKSFVHSSAGIWRLFFLLETVFNWGAGHPFVPTKYKLCRIGIDRRSKLYMKGGMLKRKGTQNPNCTSKRCIDTRMHR